MRAWIWTLILFVAAVALALLLKDHGGNVLIIAQPWRVELSLALAVVSLIVVFVALYVVLRIFGWLGNSPGRFRDWRGRRREAREMRQLEAGWLHVLEGHYIQAEKDFANLANHTEERARKVLACLSTARTLNLLGQVNKRDAMLAQARSAAANNTRLRNMVAGVEAEFLLDQNQAKEALPLLLPLQDKSLRFLHPTRLLLRAYRQLGEADQVYAITRQLLRRGAIDQEQAHTFICEATSKRLAVADESAWAGIWGDLSGSERMDPLVALAGAKAQKRFGNSNEVARILEAALGRGLDDGLLREYAQCDEDQAKKRLGHAELWLRSHPDNAGLLSALGQLCLSAQLWGQGEHYLQRSLALQPDAYVYALLGNLQDALNQPRQALKYWRQACVAIDAEIPVVNSLLPAAETAQDPVMSAINKKTAQGLNPDEEYFDSAPIPVLNEKPELTQADVR